MPEEKWEVLGEIGGSFQADILRGLLEAQGIPVVLSQEGAGHSAYVATVGPLGRVQILVPAHQLSSARKILDDYYSGAYEDTPPLDDGEIPEEDNSLE